MSDLSKGKVLVVDDEASIREILTLHMEAIGYDFVEALDGEQALELIKTHDIDVIISDILMPHLTGVEFLQILRDEGRDLPFIFITGQASVESTVRALRLGAFDYIEKPFNLDDIEKLVQEAIRVSKQKKELARFTRTHDIEDPNELEHSIQNQIMQIRALRNDENNAIEELDTGSYPSSRDLTVFVAETIPQLTFCQSSISGLEDISSVTHEAGYLFRVLQSIRMAAESLQLTEVVEFARELEECFVSLRIYSIATKPEQTQLLKSAANTLKELLEQLDAGTTPEANSHAAVKLELANFRISLEVLGGEFDETA